MHDILARFDGGDTGQTLTVLQTVGTDSYLLAPLAGAVTAANPTPTRGAGGAYHNENNYSAFAPLANGSQRLVVEFGCLAPLNASATTMTLEVICADDSALTTNVNVLAATGAIAKAKLDAASATNIIPVFASIPPINTDLLDGNPIFLGVRYTATGAGAGFGTWTAKLVDGSGSQKPATFEDGVGFL